MSSDGLRASLKQLYARTDGALALVSGRPIRDLDMLFAPLKLPCVGGHGAEMRLAGEEVVSGVKRFPASMRRQLAQAAKLDPGIEVEDKGYSLALHYRKAPQHQEWLLRQIAACCKAFPDEPCEVLTGKAMFEVKRPAVNKGESVRQLMKHSPFAGRMPVFIGDDVTDESVFSVLPEMDGKGFSVTRKFDGLAGIFDSPSRCGARCGNWLTANGRKHHDRKNHNRLWPRSRGYRQRPHRRAGQSGSAHFVVVPAAL